MQLAQLLARTSATQSASLSAKGRLLPLVGLARIEYLHAAVNHDDVQLNIKAMKIANARRCHVTLRQLDAMETSGGDKHFVVDMSTERTAQSVLRQVSA